MTVSDDLPFGEELRRERQAREISLEEISADTKISMRLLRALEESDFSRLPASIFTRGFIRAYAQRIGIDPEEKVCAYLANMKAGAPPAVSAYRPRGGSRFWRGRSATASVIVGGAVLILLVLGLIARPERRAPQREAPRMAPRGAPVAFKNVSVSNEPTPVIRQELENAAVSSPPPSPVVSLLLEFDQDSWTKVEASGDTVLRGLVRRGEVKRFETKDGSFRVTLGNAGAVRVTLGGHVLDKLGRSGEVVRDRVLRLPAVPARG